MTSEESSTRGKSILERGALGNISAEDILSKELGKSRIREESIVIPERSNQRARRLSMLTIPLHLGTSLTLDDMR